MKASKRISWTESAMLGFAPLLRFFGRGMLKTFPLVLLTIAVLIAVAMLAWKQWGGEVVAQPRFRLDPAKVTIPSQPEWIQVDVRDEVLRDASLVNASLLDSDLTVRIANAFAAHPWIAKVRRVGKVPPDKVHVDVEYRKPVALVEVRDFVYATDADGVVLPSDYFIKFPEEVRRFPRIQIDGIGLNVPVGSPWGDHRITGAAKTASLLVEGWTRYGLYRISLWVPATAHQKTAPMYELTSKSGARIIWGHAPRKESSGETVATEKVRRLERFVENNGSFADKPAKLTVDLNDAKAAIPATETARRR